MNRRTFFRRTVGALATAAIAPRLQLSFTGPWTLASAPYEGVVVDTLEDACRLYAAELGRAAALQQEQLAAAVFNNSFTA